MIRDIYFHGVLADKYGPGPVRLRADSWPMLLRGLQVVFPDLRRTLMEAKDIAIVKRDGDNVRSLTEETLNWNFGRYPEVHLATSYDGAVVPAAITIAGTVYTGWAAAAIYIAINIAISIAVSFVMNALAQKPPTREGQQKDRNESNLFNGAVNVLQQGHPVPLVYGTFKVGSVTISTEVAAEKQALAFNDVVQLEAGASVAGNVLSNDIGVNLEVTSFVVNGVTQAPGTTYDNGSYTVTIAANGVYSITASASFQGTFEVTINSTGANTPVLSSLMTVQVYAPIVYDSGGGGGEGPGGPGDGGDGGGDGGDGGGDGGE